MRVGRHQNNEHVLLLLKEICVDFAQLNEKTDVLIEIRRGHQA